MSEEDFKKLEEIFNNDNSFKTDGIWALSILMLLFMNKPDKEQPIINVYLGGE